MGMNDSKKEIVKGALSKVKLVDTGVSAKIRYGGDHCHPTKSEKDRIIYPNLYLDLKEAPMLTGIEVEDEVTLLIKARVVSHSLRESEGKKNENFDLQIRKMGVVSTHKKHN